MPLRMLVQHIYIASTVKSLSEQMSILQLCQGKSLTAFLKINIFSSSTGFPLSDSIELLSDCKNYEFSMTSEEKFANFPKV